MLDIICHIFQVYTYMYMYIHTPIYISIYTCVYIYIHIHAASEALRFYASFGNKTGIAKAELWFERPVDSRQ